jgi:phosphoribosylformimino-5-aminoimidazole carboxamide ribotide isomerase
MDIIPAVDIKDGQAVRLKQGDFDRVTVFDKSPLAAVKRWANAGAKWIHIVDLDGARAGKPVNHALVGEAAKATTSMIQLGGGLRDIASVQAAIGLGVSRVVLGTAALEKRELLHAARRKFPDRILVGVDARNGKVATHGWKKESTISAIEAIKELSLPGIAAIVFTDITRDGMMEGPNLEALGQAVTAARIPIIASGGISSIADLASVANSGASGAIIGRALYDGSIDLAEALRAAAGV